MLIRIKGAISNCYLLLGERPVLVDTGAPGDLKRILAALKAVSLKPEDLALILLTHGHSNHAGCAAELRRRSGAQVALHIGDCPLVRQGRNGILAAQDTLGRVLRPFVDEQFEAFEPDLIFREGISLETYGVKGKVLATPGHTPGSISVVLASGEAIIGDLLRGSVVWPNKSRPHWFCNDAESNGRSIVRLAREGLLRCHPGVYGSFPGTELGRYLSTDGGQVLALSGEPV
ncbi:MBL fold metallo-hydrolase [Oleiharenicola lentus]|jgi:glyoxylase-like metal-dependent hydrolase (beta-lactamase superfamily II)|uniref:MBL fold metallo-hydrolase n=1 Tax=Oleiharenicola lentus TaxID=2508720 RepID=A0A4Q1C9Z3_9BACT|nr:MBL fold metallo-hydrolase [Oleiharenicola lentus]RXK55814.1 MBL fold metallo-hydrolase [Oleiharenicola lentus]